MKASKKPTGHHLYPYLGKNGKWYFTVRDKHNQKNRIFTSPPYSSRSGRNYAKDQYLVNNPNTVLHKSGEKLP